MVGKGTRQNDKRHRVHIARVGDGPNIPVKKARDGFQDCDLRCLFYMLFIEMGKDEE